MDKNNFKIAVIADLHYFSPTLGTAGTAYELRSAQDQKCLAESGAIIDAAFDSIISAAPDCVLIAGDLANNGEMISHIEVIEKIKRLNASIPVFVTYSTHDWCCDGRSRRFVGDETLFDVETADPPALREMYKPFGVSSAESEYVTHLGSSSYSLSLNNNLRLIAANDDQNGKGASGYTDEHFDWILSECRKARESGQHIILMQHHLLLSNISEIINKGQHIGDNLERAEALADAGVSLVICGHSHMHRTTRFVSKNNNTLIQLNQGALCGHPAPITYLTVDGGSMSMDMQSVESFNYNGETKPLSFITEHSRNVILSLLNYAANDRDKFFRLLDDNDISAGKLNKIYPVVKHAAKYALNATVGSAGRLVNALTLGRGVDKQSVRAIKNDNLINHIADLFLSVFDGSIVTYTSADPVYRIVTDAASLPRRITAKLPIKKLKNDKLQSVFKEIENIAHELIAPSEPDNHHFTFEMQ